VGGAHPIYKKIDKSMWAGPTLKKEKLIWYKSRKKSHIYMKAVSLFPHLTVFRKDPLLHKRHTLKKMWITLIKLFTI